MPYDQQYIHNDKRLRCAYKRYARRGALELGYTAPADTAGRIYFSGDLR
jgi:hypothetical protein